MNNFLLCFIFITSQVICPSIFEKDNKIVFDRVIQNNEKVKSLLEKIQTFKEKMITDHEILDVYMQKKIHQLETLVKLKEKQRIEKEFGIIINNDADAKYREQRKRQLQMKMEQLEKLKRGEAENPYTEDQQKSMSNMKNKHELKKIKNAYEQVANELSQKQKKLKQVLAEIASINVSTKKLKDDNLQTELENSKDETSENKKTNNNDNTTKKILKQLKQQINVSIW